MILNFIQNLVIENTGLFLWFSAKRNQIKNKLEDSASSITITIENNSSIFNEIALSKNQGQSIL